MKFAYSTRLNPSEKTDNRVTLVAPNVALLVMNGQRTFFNIVTEDLPFTAAIRRAYKDVCDNTEAEYFNIGTRPETPFTISDVEILHINYTMFLIAMRRAQARHTWFKTLPHYFTSYVREDILSSTYIHKLKLLNLQILNRGWSPSKNRHDIQQLYVDHGFSAETMQLFFLFWHSGEALKMLNMLLENKEPFLLDVDYLLEETNLVVAESNLISLAQFYAAKKLEFVASSNRYQTQDFASELLNRARISYLNCRPFLGRQHALNYARSTISTYYLRIIQHFTEESRARLINTHDGGMTNRFVSLDSTEHDMSSGNGIEDALIAMIDLKSEMLYN